MPGELPYDDFAGFATGYVLSCNVIVATRLSALDDSNGPKSRSGDYLGGTSTNTTTLLVVVITRRPDTRVLAAEGNSNPNDMSTSPFSNLYSIGDFAITMKPKFLD